MGNVQAEDQQSLVQHKHRVFVNLGGGSSHRLSRYFYTPLLIECSKLTKKGFLTLCRKYIKLLAKT